MRAYAVSSPTLYAAYLHHYADHQNAVSGLMLTVDPLAAGSAVWIDCATGAILAAPRAIEVPRSPSTRPS